MKETPVHPWYFPNQQRQELTPIQQLRIGWNSLRDHFANASERMHSPTYLLEAIKQTAKENNISRWDVVRILRERKNPETAVEIRHKYQEKILYVGCVHGGDQEFIDYLRNLSVSPTIDLPNTLIFGGDIGGAKNQRTIKQKMFFYDYLMNRAGPALRQNENLTQEELLNTKGNQPPLDSLTIRDGAIKLLQFTLTEMAEYQIPEAEMGIEMKKLMLTQMKESLTEKEMSTMNFDELLDKYVRWIFKNNLNSGTWVGTLPKEIRQAYMDQYVETATTIASSLNKLQERGVKVIWIEGNEDNLSSLKNIMDSLERGFDTQQYFEDHGIHCVKKISGFESKTTYHLLLPYFPIHDYEQIDPKVIIDLKRKVEIARQEGKTIVMVAHAQIDWNKHKPGETATGYNAKIINNLRQAIIDFQPDELVHPHQHWEMPEKPEGVDAKYIIGGKPTVVTYLPLLKTGELTLPVYAVKERRWGIIFSDNQIVGPRQPVHRLN